MIAENHYIQPRFPECLSKREMLLLLELLTRAIQQLSSKSQDPVKTGRWRSFLLVGWNCASTATCSEQLRAIRLLGDPGISMCATARCTSSTRVSRAASTCNIEFWQHFMKDFAYFWRARSRLYQNEILQENMRLTAFFKLYKTCILLHRCNLKMLAKNWFEKSATFVKIQQHE